MKLLFGMPSKDSWGGPAASEPPFVEALAELGVEVSTETYVFGDKQRPTPLFSRISRVIKTALRFRRRLQAEQFDLVHLNTAFDRRTILRDAVSLWLMRPRNTRIFLKIHGAAAQNINESLSLYKPFIGYLNKRVDGFGVFTGDERSELLSHGIDSSKLFRVKNAIELKIDAARGINRRQKSQNECFELLFAARFIVAKGLLETISACALLRDRGKHFRLTCVGDGPIRSEAEELSRKLSLIDQVEFTGYISEDEVLKRQMAADIFVFPTRHPEGFPIALFRAAAVGLPIVTTPVRAAAEYFQDKKNCLFCSNEPADIANKIETLTSDRALREMIVEANRELGQQFAPEIIASEYLELYRKITSRSALISTSAPSDPPH